MILLKANTTDGIQTADLSPDDKNTVYGFSDFYSMLPHIVSNKEVFGFVTEEEFELIDNQYGVR